MWHVSQTSATHAEALTERAERSSKQPPPPATCPIASRATTRDCLVSDSTEAGMGEAAPEDGELVVLA